MRTFPVGRTGLPGSRVLWQKLEPSVMFWAHASTQKRPLYIEPQDSRGCPEFSTLESRDEGDFTFHWCLQELPSSGQEPPLLCQLWKRHRVWAKILISSNQGLCSLKCGFCLAFYWNPSSPMKTYIRMEKSGT